MSLNRKTLASRTNVKLGHSFSANIQHQKLSSTTDPDLGEWEVYQWQVFENRIFVERGSYHCSDNIITFNDAIDQLEWEFIDKHSLIECGPSESPSDADNGL